MPSEVKMKLYKLLEEINDDATLNHLMDEISFYTSQKDVLDELSDKQVEELNQAIAEAEKGDTISLKDFKKEMNEWQKKSVIGFRTFA